MEKILRITTTDEESLTQGVEDIVALLAEIEQNLSRKEQRKCATCPDREWMNPGETSCWRCQRIQEHRPVAKPNGDLGYFWWNYRISAWVAQPANWIVPSGPEWGERDEEESVV